jgi:hypothetical protein
MTEYWVVITNSISDEQAWVFLNKANAITEAVDHAKTIVSDDRRDESGRYPILSPDELFHADCGDGYSVRVFHSWTEDEDEIPYD